MRFVYAKVSSSGVAMARLAEKRRQFVAALGSKRCDSDALDAYPSGSGAADAGQDPGAMSLHVALAESSAWNAQIAEGGSIHARNKH
jgi:hypothetical protein